MARISTKQDTKSLSGGRPIIGRYVRVGSADLEKVLADMGRMTEDNKRRARRVLVEGISMADVADADKVSRELVSNVVRRVREKLNTQLDAWTYVEIPLRLPLSLAEELRGLSDGIAKMDDPAKAEVILTPVLKAILAAKSKVLYGD